MILNKEKRNKKDIYFQADKFNKQLIPIRIEGSPVYLKSINYNRLVQMYVDYERGEYNEGYFEYLFNKREVLNLEDSVIAVKCKFNKNDEYFSIEMQYKKDNSKEIDGLNIYFFNKENIHPQNFTYNDHISTRGSNIDIGIYNALEDKYIYLMTISGSLYRIEDIYLSRLLDIYCKYKFRGGILDSGFISNIYPEYDLVSIDRDYYNNSESFIPGHVLEKPGGCYCKLFSNFIETNQNIIIEAMDIILKLNYTLGLTINAVEDNAVKGYEDRDFIYAYADYVIATIYFYKEPVIVEGDMHKTYG